MSHSLSRLHVPALAPLLVLLAALLSCSRGEFTLEFDLDPGVPATYTAVWYDGAKGAERMVESAAAVTDGKGVLKGRTGGDALVLLSAPGELTLPVYLPGGGTVKITGNGRTTLDWEVGGDQVNKDLSEWRRRERSLLEARNADSTNLAVARYVYAHPASPASAVLLLADFDRRADETLFRRLWQGLAPEADAARMASLAARADLPDGRVRTPGHLKSVVFRSLLNGTDTLRPDSTRAMLLYFWANGGDSRREAIDTLRSLARQYRDSTTRVIADISVDADSLSWRSPLRQDSLQGLGVNRLWSPAGLADVQVMQLGVPRVPFFILIGPDGHQKFRGDGVAEAAAEFRRLAGEPGERDKNKNKNKKD